LLLPVLLLAPPPLPPPLNLQAALNDTGLPAIIMSLKSKAKAKRTQSSFNNKIWDTKFKVTSHVQFTIVHMSVN
jgi:hypothetical protein